MIGELDSFLPYGRQQIDEEDVASVVAVLNSEWLTTGPAVTAFEQAFAERVGARFAVVCSSGTAALHLAALALGLGRGDTVIVPTLTFVATANASVLVGADVQFADVDPRTGLMGTDHLRQAIAGCGDSRPCAVFPVHLTGQCSDPEALCEVAREHDLKVIEDACHSLGSSYVTASGSTHRVGACRHSDMTLFSLHPVKTIAMGEGGVVTTNNPELHERLLRMRNHGLVRDPEAFQETAQAFAGDGEPNPWYYEMPEPGLNYRASDINCALGLSQLGKLERFVERRRTLAALYDKALVELAPVVRPAGRQAGCDAAWHLYVVLIDFDAAGIDRAALMKNLRQHGVGTQVHYLPVHRQPYYRQRCGDLNLVGADAYYAGCLSLPLYPAMSERDVDRVVAALARCVEGSVHRN